MSKRRRAKKPPEMRLYPFDIVADRPWKAAVIFILMGTTFGVTFDFVTHYVFGWI